MKLGGKSARRGPSEPFLILKFKFNSFKISYHLDIRCPSCYNLAMRNTPLLEGEYYHIYNRGIDKREIFKSEKDFERFVMLLYVANSSDKPLRLDNLINILHKKFEEILLFGLGVL